MTRRHGPTRPLEEAPLFGFFRKVVDMGWAEAAGDLYEGEEGAWAYEAVTGLDASDVNLYLEWLREHGEPLLDLGCGTGRIAVPLARAGFRVTGVDRSPEMLALLERKVRLEPPETAARLNWLQADIRFLEQAGLPLEGFGSAILGATSFSLLGSHEDRVAALRGAARHLRAGGTLFFDFLEFPDEVTSAEPYVEAIAVPSFPGFALLGHSFEPEEERFTLNLFVETEREGHVRRQVFWSEKTMLDGSVVAQALEEAGLREVWRHTVPVPFPGVRGVCVHYLACEPGA